jgi:polyhydroxyalkanoate synthesis regulator phasin
VRAEESESKGCIVAESWQSYANLVGGLTRNVRDRAASPVRDLLARAGMEEVAVDAWERLTKLVDEVGQASRANRELLEKLVVAEVDKVAARLGFVRSEELQELRAEVAELRKELRAATQPAGAGRKPASKRGAAKKAAMKKAAKTAAAAE